MRAIIGNEKRTLVEEARVKMKRARRKHKESLAGFPDALMEELPSVILEAADKNLTRIAWDMSTSKAFEHRRKENRHFLLNDDTLPFEEWEYVFQTMISKLKVEPELAWKPFDVDRPQILEIIWDTI